MRKQTDFDKYVQEKIKKYPFLKEELKKADQAWDIAGQVYDLRKRAGLTQKELAELVGTVMHHEIIRTNRLSLNHLKSDPNN